MNLSSLSPSELRVAEHIALDMSDKEIATRLFNSPQTISTHVKRMKKKLKVNSRVGIAVKYVMENSKTFTLSILFIGIQSLGMTMANDDVRLPRRNRARRTRTEIIA